MLEFCFCLEQDLGQGMGSANPDLHCHSVFMVG
ncbi:Uncharacterised protein [Edwardsiella hoshinae]|uniref:Uncharacterized protein n=1 Tax=Edwardsiella hoshinae TaxID=93378 RepID=A0A376D9T9_9GAMM|nr:Uncharacterised protein [Edwardsiella hoshinae]